jgi:DNA modification methylase
VLTRKDMMTAHEWCFYGWREGAAHKWFGPNNIPDVWQIKKINPLNMCHITEKPVELAARAIEYSSKSGENVLDLFGGSGSTLIACEQLHRNAYLMEIDTLYCDVIVQRYCQFTGQEAIRITPKGKRSRHRSLNKQAA